MEDADQAYLAGLFDGEGCASAIITSKAYKEHRNFCPRVHFGITGKGEHMKQVKLLFGIGGGVYKRKNYDIWDFRVTYPAHVIQAIDLILPYVKLKNEQLVILRRATEFLLQHECHSRWKREDVKHFEREFVQILHELKGLNRKKGRKRIHYLDN